MLRLGIQLRTSGSMATVHAIVSTVVRKFSLNQGGILG